MFIAVHPSAGIGFPHFCGFPAKDSLSWSYLLISGAIVARVGLVGMPLRFAPRHPHQTDKPLSHYNTMQKIYKTMP